MRKIIKELKKYRNWQELKLKLIDTLEKKKKVIFLSLSPSTSY